MTLRAVLVDDHELIRQGLAGAFARAGGWEVVGQAGDVAEGLSVARTTRPDVVVTDLQLPDGSGLDVVRALRGDRADVGLVMLTMHVAHGQVRAALEAGASAFLGKTCPGREVVVTARCAALSPRSFVAPALTGTLRRSRSLPSAGDGGIDPESLTERETAVLRLVAQGCGTREMAASLHLGESTVKTHLHRIYRKLGVANRTQALAAGVRLGLVLEPGRDARPA